MSELDRGTCPVCRQRWAVRKGGLMRQHRRSSDYPWLPKATDPWCDGSGKPATQLWRGTTGQPA